MDVLTTAHKLIPSPVWMVLKRLFKALQKRLPGAVAGRLDRYPILSCTYSNFRLYYPIMSHIGRGMALGGRAWDSNLGPTLTCLFPQPSPVIAEVGSNIGASLLQMELAKPQARFYCFEPSDRFVPFLQANIRVNNWSNVRLETLLLSDRVETQQLFNNATTASVVTPDYDSHKFLYAQKTIVTSTLDAYFATSDELDMIKVDTDGYDYPVLVGAERTIRRFHPVLYFEFTKSLITHAGYDPADFLRYLFGLGYRRYLIFSEDGRAIALESDIDAVLNVANSHNYVDILTVSSQQPTQESRMTELFERL